MVHKVRSLVSSIYLEFKQWFLCGYSQHSINMCKNMITQNIYFVGQLRCYLFDHNINILTGIAMEVLLVTTETSNEKIYIEYLK